MAIDSVATGIIPSLFCCIIELLSLLHSLVKRSVASPLSPQGLCWLSHYISKNQLGLCPVLSPAEMQLEAAAGSPQLARQDLWQHVWVVEHLFQTVHCEDGLCRVVEASRVVSPITFGSVVAAAVCKGKYVSKQSVHLL